MMINEMMEKLGITREQLQETMKEVSEDQANELMNMALEDVKKIKQGRGSEEELAVKVYRAYLIGFSLGQHHKKEKK